MKAVKIEKPRSIDTIRQDFKGNWHMLGRSTRELTKTGTDVFDMG